MRCSTVAMIFLATVFSSGCQSYRPSPVDPAEFALRHEQRQIDVEAVRREVARLAPGYSWNGTDWNTLTLFAAAMTTSPEVATARAQLMTAEANVDAARVRPGPTLTLAAEYAFNAVEASPWLIGAAGDILLDSGGRRRARIDAAEASVRSAQFDYLATIWNTRMAVRRAVDERLVADKEAQLRAEVLELRRQQLGVVRHRVSAGEVGRLDLDLVRGDEAAAAIRRAASEADQMAARLSLATTLGVSPAAIGLAGLGSTHESRQEAAPVSAADRVAALAARTEILRIMTEYDQAEAALKTAVAAQYPEVHVGAGYVWERGLRKLPFALSLALPAADFGKAAIRAAETRRAELGTQMEAAVARVLADIDRADADYRAAWAVLALIRRENLPTAEAIAGQADRELAAGAIDRADWAASQVGVLATKLDEAAALRSVLLTESALEDALRKPLSGPELEIDRAVDAVAAGHGS